MSEAQKVEASLPKDAAPRRYRWFDVVRQAARMTARDWRAGELTMLALALVLAVTALSSVGFLADRLQQGLVGAFNRLAPDGHVEGARFWFTLPVETPPATMEALEADEAGQEVVRETAQEPTQEAAQEATQQAHGPGPGEAAAPATGGGTEQAAEQTRSAAAPAELPGASSSASPSGPVPGDTTASSASAGAPSSGADRSPNPDRPDPLSGSTPSAHSHS